MMLRQPQQSNRLKVFSEHHTISFRKGKETFHSPPKEPLQTEEIMPVLSRCMRTRWMLGVKRKNIYKRNYNERAGRERVRT